MIRLRLALQSGGSQPASGGPTCHELASKHSPYAPLVFDREALHSPAHSLCSLIDGLR
jgi:hypothetical protein